MLESFQCQEVRREPFTVLVSANHELGRRRSLDMPALRNLPFILFEIGFALNRIILDACRRHGFEPTSSLGAAQIDFIVELAEAGLGDGFLPLMIAEQRKHASVRRILLSQHHTDWHIAMI
jgi:DNA-binding transcriptional LysR family regulator